MKAPFLRRYSVTQRLVGLFSLLLIVFAVILSLLYNTLMRRQMILHYSKSMQRDAYAISQNLSELMAPSNYDTLDENRFIVSEATLAPYLALTEQLTNCSVYLVDVHHNVTGYFEGVVQTLNNPLLPVYLEQTIALGFMGKTPFIQADEGGDTHLTACMPVMNAQSRVLGVVLLETSLKVLGFAQVPSGTILITSLVIAFALSLVLAAVFSGIFTRPISTLDRLALSLAEGRYETRTHMNRRDEIGSLASTMDVLAERLEDARRLDEKMKLHQQQLFSNISHELRTPVTVIRGSLESLRDGVVTQPNEIRQCYDQMIRESQWLQRLIRDLLELSRLQSDEYELEISRVELSELLGDIAMSANALCEQKGVRLVCEEPKARFNVTGDRSRLRQMLLAVVDNAVKFTPPGGQIRIWLENDRPSMGVSDEGVGIPSGELPHIFDRFHHRRDPSYNSTGLGLAIVKEIARRHGVEIAVESREGEGTVFRFVFSGEGGEVLNAPPGRASIR